MNIDLPPKYDETKLTTAHKQLLATLPFPDLFFRQLFDYLDIELSQSKCQHDFNITTQFLKTKEIDLVDHLSFFNHHNVACDCQILYDLEPIFPIDLNEFKRNIPDGLSD